MGLDSLTRILRGGDADALEADLIAVLVEGESEWVKDDRDLMMCLAPYHDCASRLGADEAALFRRAAAAGPASIRSVVEAFGARTDITPESFGFLLVTTPEGPRYRWAGE